MNNRFYKFNVLERISVRFINKLKKAALRFELGIRICNPLPYHNQAADSDFIESLNNPTVTSLSLLIICNGHGEDVIVLK